MKFLYLTDRSGSYQPISHEFDAHDAAAAARWVRRYCGRWRRDMCNDLDVASWYELGAALEGGGWVLAEALNMDEELWIQRSELR